MSKREPQNLPLTNDDHAAVLTSMLNVIQSVNDEATGGSQIWFESGGITYKATVEKCAGPLRDLTGKNKMK